MSISRLVLKIYKPHNFAHASCDCSECSMLKSSTAFAAGNSLDWEVRVRVRLCSLNLCYFGLSILNLSATVNISDNLRVRTSNKLITYKWRSNHNFHGKHIISKITISTIQQMESSPLSFCSLYKTHYLTRGRIMKQGSNKLTLLPPHTKGQMRHRNNRTKLL